MGRFSEDEMEKGYKKIQRITKRNFWMNRNYSSFNSDENYASEDKISTATTLEEITAYVTFINRSDHFCARWDNTFPSTAWHGVIMSGRFEAIMDKLVDEFNKMKNGG